MRYHHRYQLGKKLEYGLIYMCMVPMQEGQSPEIKWKFIEQLVTVVTSGKEGGIEKGGENRERLHGFPFIFL